MNILDKIVEKTRVRTAVLNIRTLKEEAYKLELGNFPFKKALLASSADSSKIKIIAEVKKASPSKGVIAKDFDPEKIAGEYKAANVDCISVLTEPFFFEGKNSYVEIVKKASSKPVLRKDFIINPAQIYEAKIIGADCILLICAILDKQKIGHYLEIAQTLGLSAIVECHNEEEIEIALNSGAEIIGVNNRNLKTFEVDFNNSLRLKKLVPNDRIFVSESGIKTRDNIKKLEEAGVNAVLIGETFMRSKDKINAIKKLKGLV